MNIKQVVITQFGDKKMILEQRYRSTKALFIISALLFFIDLFLLFAHFSHPFFLLLFQFLFTSLIVSVCLLIYFHMRYYLYEKIPQGVQYAIGGILAIIAIFCIIIVHMSIN